MSDEPFSERYFVLVRSTANHRSLYSLESAAQLTGVHRDLLQHYCRIGLLGEERASPETEPVFDDDALYDVRQIEQLRRHQGVNLRALPLLWNMSREMNRLRAEVRFLRDR